MRLVLVPAVVTLAFTLVRLWGEIHGWSPRWFSTEPGGQAAFFGIVWLVPIFGAMFGWKLARAGQAPARPGIAALWHLGAFALFGGLGFATVKLVPFPQAGYVFSACAWLVALLGLRAWPALFRANALYGVLARLPVVVITYIAVYANWGTHYEKLGPENLRLPEFQRATFLSFAQLGLWIAFTIIVGGLFGSLAAILGRRGRAG